MSCEKTEIRPSVNCINASSRSGDSSNGRTVRLRNGGAISLDRIFESPVNCVWGGHKYVS